MKRSENECKCYKTQELLIPHAQPVQSISMKPDFIVFSGASVLALSKPKRERVRPGKVGTENN
jgi:hypothetical protein